MTYNITGSGRVDHNYIALLGYFFRMCNHCSVYDHGNMYPVKEQSTLNSMDQDYSQISQPLIIIIDIRTCYLDNFWGYFSTLRIWTEQGRPYL